MNLLRGSEKKKKYEKKLWLERRTIVIKSK